MNMSGIVSDYNVIFKNNKYTCNSDKLKEHNRKNHRM